MFIGHYAVALAAKRVALRTSLGTLFAATSLADLLWPVFLLFGWEQAHVVPGPNPFLTLWLDSIPISHSLITLIGWGALFAYLYRVRTSDGRAALVVALLVVSHWVLDYVTHRPDMPLYPGGTPLGLGLWNSVTGTVAVEGVMFVAGCGCTPRLLGRVTGPGLTASGRSSRCWCCRTSARSSVPHRRRASRSRSAVSFSAGCSWRGRGGGIGIERDGALPGRALPETALPVTAWPESALNASPATPHSVTSFPVTPHSS